MAFEVWGSRNLLKNDRGTKLAFKCVSDSVSGRFFDDFGAPKRSKNESGTRRFGHSKKYGVAKLWKSQQTSQTQRASGGFAYLSGSPYD